MKQCLALDYNVLVMDSNIVRSDWRIPHDQGNFGSTEKDRRTTCGHRLPLKTIAHHQHVICMSRAELS